MDGIRNGHTAQERGLLWLMGIVLVASGILFLLDARPPSASVAVSPIRLEEVTVLLPRFVPVGPVDVNQASVDELIALPGIGPALAARIVSYREEHGMFRSLDDLQKVSGIGPQTVNGLRDKAVAGTASVGQ